LLNRDPEPGGFNYWVGQLNSNTLTRDQVIGLFLSSREFLGLDVIFTNNDYTLFCDNKENTLNYLNYNVIGTTKAYQILETNLDVNNFCVLTYENEVVVATSINNKISSGVFSNIRSVFSAGSCSNSDILNSDGQFHDCNSTQTNRLWINNRTGSIIYSKNRIPVGGDSGLSPNSIRDSINFIITAIRDILLSSSELTPQKDDYLKKVNRFDRLYMAEKSGKSIKGSLYNKFSNIRTAAIEYSGFTTNVCTLVNEYGNRIPKSSNPDAISEISCKEDSGKYYVLVQGSISTAPGGEELTGINPDKIWPDLTSKLRLK
jgi:hypothetical protein